MDLPSPSNCSSRGCGGCESDQSMSQQVPVEAKVEVASNLPPVNGKKLSDSMTTRTIRNDAATLAPVQS